MNRLNTMLHCITGVWPGQITISPAWLAQEKMQSKWCSVSKRSLFLFEYCSDGVLACF